MRLLLSAITLLLLPAWLPAKGQGIPHEGQRQTFWIVDAEIPEAPPEGGVVDLSNSPIIDSYDAVCHAYGDTLFSVSRPGVKSWYLLREDGAWLVGENDRSAQRSYSAGLPHIPACPAGMAIESSDSVRTWLNSGAERRSRVGQTLRAMEGWSFALAPGDTAKADMLLLSVREEAWGEEEGAVLTTRRWYCAGLVFPVVREDIAEWKGGMLPSSDRLPALGADRRRARRREVAVHGPA